MQVQERLIVPGLGVVILLSVFMMGASLMYLLLLGLLGLAAVGTYYVPHAVQVETRIGIAALGLILLIFYFSSLGFWLALLSFGAIGALQIRYRDTLQSPPETIAWLNAVLTRRGASGAAAGEAGAGGAAPAITLPAKLGFLQGKLSIAGIVAAVLGVIILLTAAMPWYSITSGGDTETFSGWGLAGAIEEKENDGLQWVFVWTLAALALASVASFLLPRVVPIAIGIAGLVVTIVAMVYVVGVSDVTDQRARDAGVMFSFGSGAVLTALAFILIAALHFIPALYKPLGGDQARE